MVKIALILADVQVKGARGCSEGVMWERVSRIFHEMMRMEPIIFVQSSKQHDVCATFVILT